MEHFGSVLGSKPLEKELNEKGIIDQNLTSGVRALKI
jgi:hypothetical protein